MHLTLCAYLASTMITLSDISHLHDTPLPNWQVLMVSRFSSSPPPPPNLSPNLSTGITRKMLHHPGVSLSELQNASEMSTQTCMRYSASRTTMATRAMGYVSQLNHELARESLLCMSGHAKHLPEANLAIVHSLSLTTCLAGVTGDCLICSYHVPYFRK